MGKYQAYPEYKDSGVEWLELIPNQWDRLKFKFTSKEGKAFASGPFGSSIGSQFYRDSGVPVIRGNNLSLNGNKPKFVDDGYVFLDEIKADELSNAEVIAGDLVFTARGTVGQVGLVPSQGDFTWGRAILSANQLRFRNHDTGFNSNYLWYLFSSWLIRTQVLLSSDSVAQPNLNLGSLKDLHLFRPAFEEQVSIANFLDHETAKIDTLIEQQQQLIKLLKEKRQAVISHAVTKGLSSLNGGPNAPMKDSGVEWLGEVPAHWDIRSLRYLGECQNGINIGAEFFGSGFPFVSYGDVYKNESLPKAVNGLVRSTISDRKTYSVLEGDVIFTRTSETIDEIGLSSVCMENLDDASFAGFLIRFRPKKDVIDKNYSKFYFRNILLRAFFVKEMNLVTRASLSQDLLKKLPVTLPSLTEQYEIAMYLERQSSIFSKLIANVENTIELMKERRTALIFAAVTGKIDVRHFVAEDGQPPQ